jgi:tetratricopeptide (TPR) repeat protein
LTWAREQIPSWKTTYYLGLVHWNNLHADKAKELFQQCGDLPDFSPFYIARGTLFQGDSAKKGYVGENFKRAIEIQPTEWRGWHYRSEYLFDNGLLKQAYVNATQAYKRFRANPVIAMGHAKVLLNTGRLDACLDVLNNALVLPQEGAQEGHDIYELANLSLALQMVEQKKYPQAIKYLDDAKKWPENLGSGSPYNPDTRLHDFIAAYCQKKMGHQKEAGNFYKKITEYSLDKESWMGSRNPVNHFISVMILNQEGKQEELKQLMAGWKTEQDSIRNWSLGAGSASPEFRWVMAKYNGEIDKADVLEKELMAGPAVNRVKLFFRALKVAGKEK